MTIVEVYRRDSDHPTHYKCTVCGSEFPVTGNTDQWAHCDNFKLTNRLKLDDGWWEVRTKQGKYMFTCPTEQYAIGFQSGADYGYDLARKVMRDMLGKELPHPSES